MACFIRTQTPQTPLIEPTISRPSIRNAVYVFLNFVLVVSTCSTMSLGQQNLDELSQPIVSPEVVFQEVDGFVAVEAEHFFKQTMTEKRAFYLTATDKTPVTSSDGDAVHVAGASNGAYLEILPDTRRNHGEKLIGGVNFSNVPGKLAILHYKVNFQTTGRYYVWVRAHSTGSEDNGLHVGINGTWPPNGQRLQWCEGKRQWWWESKQRTQKKHCGVPHQIFLDIEKAGEHIIQFSMREDGFEFDKWLMTTNRDFARPVGSAAKPIANTDSLPAFPLVELSLGSSVLENDNAEKGDKPPSHPPSINK